MRMRRVPINEQAYVTRCLRAEQEHLTDSEHSVPENLGMQIAKSLCSPLARVSQALSLSSKLGIPLGESLTICLSGGLTAPGSECAVAFRLHYWSRR